MIEGVVIEDDTIGGCEEGRVGGDGATTGAIVALLIDEVFPELVVIVGVVSVDLGDAVVVVEVRSVRSMTVLLHGTTGLVGEATGAVFVAATTVTGADDLP